jgi:hypothetical protein
VRASEAEEGAAWCLWLWLRLGGATPGCDFDAALRELRAAGGRRSLGGRWRLRERRGRDLAANPERPVDKSNGEGPNEANAQTSRAGRFWRVS